MERIESIDVLRGFAIILVVMGHVVEKNGLSDSGLYNWIYSFHMPLFMCLSGFVTRYSYSLEKEFGKIHLDYVFRKFKAIIIPYVVWGGIISPFFFLPAGRNIDYAGFLRSMFVTNTSYWFLPCLFGLIVLFSVYMGVRRMCRKGGILLDISIVILLVLIVAVLYSFTHYDMLRSILNYALPFFIGVYAAGYLKFRSFIFSNSWVYTVVFLVFCLIEGWFVSSSGTLNKGIRLCTGIAALPVCFYFVTHVVLPGRVKKQLVFIGQNTLVIYVMHEYFLYFWKFTNGGGMNIGIQFICFGLYSVIVVYICLFLSQFFKISPFLRVLTLGRK